MPKRTKKRRKRKAFSEKREAFFFWRKKREEKGLFLPKKARVIDRNKSFCYNKKDEKGAKKRMKTEAARRVLALSVATVAVLLLLSACAQKAYECGYFTYKIVRYGETEQAFILGLTEERQKQEYLVVPEEVVSVRI